MSVSTMHIRCRKAGCGQLLAVLMDTERGYRVYADVKILGGGRASLICPACEAQRRFDYPDGQQVPTSIARRGQADAA